MTKLISATIVLSAVFVGSVFPAFGQQCTGRAANNPDAAKCLAAIQNATQSFTSCTMYVSPGARSIGDCLKDLNSSIAQSELACANTSLACAIGPYSFCEIAKQSMLDCSFLCDNLMNTSGGQVSNKCSRHECSVGLVQVLEGYCHSPPGTRESTVDIGPCAKAARDLGACYGTCQNLPEQQQNACNSTCDALKGDVEKFCSPSTGELRKPVLIPGHTLPRPQNASPAIFPIEGGTRVNRSDPTRTKGATRIKGHTNLQIKPNTQ